MSNNLEDEKSLIFALDIGTRSVVGLLGTMKEDKILIKHSTMEFHKERVMYDGQIHDIEGVSKIVQKVKDSLEDASGTKLEEVAVAAAGRSLKTHQLTIEKKIDPIKTIDKHLINSIEIEGLQNAQQIIEEQSEDTTEYFCVGHTVVNYYLNGSIITNPEGHRGETISIEIIATFLPQIVIESLHTVMRKVGLEINYMTLEPIAAIEVAVPKNVRLLNVALVDIGAGTSDIAITKEGSIVAYAMTSTAGDEITETISKNYLMDFDSAEALKCNLCKLENQNFTDILGMNYELRTEEILESIHPSIESVGKDIANSILEQNGKAPSAVFLIGGGSQIPGLTNVISNNLNLPNERVAVRGIETVQNVIHDNTVLTGPEGITPAGILTKAINNKLTDFLSITVNEQKVRLFQSKKLKVSDALVLIGFNPRDLIPKKGKALKIFINGKQKTIFGEYGQPAIVKVNGHSASLDTAIKNNDDIKIQPAEPGKSARCFVEEAVKNEFGFSVNGQFTDGIFNIKINGDEPTKEQILNDGDKIDYKQVITIEDLCNLKSISFNQYDIYKNGKLSEINETINNNDKIIITEKQEVFTRKDENNKVDYSKGYKEYINVTYNNQPLKIPLIKDNMLFVDIFNFVDFDRTKAQGRLVLKHNGKNASYTEALYDGDDIEVYWE
ncbi:cell division FtsA domain-containing protein [Serpentinicella sp. ANB-PHB4]|uniref:cell division protein FtsA n=1 Tax=Serpentinicella sp. ANB-PHB4 TaxID=3074076 RepID=UPI00286310F8|nr:cell division FtsA domain-containing protein [Serpentinicella sp. ANB-PHB4]MDR5658994.1 cell division FtsA domain-containing protein [Serpentinicella sp. ANB-PHB4]